MEPIQTDDLLSSLLGDTLQSATLRLVGGTLALACIIGLVVYIIH